ncbi:metallophosphoesterase [Singulisphaera sp. GP187]|uniref:metallophosphoesterase n=1 Tax=Singulisphaera sp. GP187 TaxID=1882752 RepID=UPI0011610BAD|nr:metallophosphoesterase [Singulisphaera sp. GP187]
MKKAYRFVHLSDVHFGQERDGTLVTHDHARNRLIRDCRLLREQLGPADGILITGDVAFGGKQEEYDRAGQWIDLLVEAVGCETIDVRIIPGNHDVDRGCIDRFCQIAHKHLRTTETGKVDAELESMMDAREEGNSLLPKLAAYREFASRFGCDFPSARNPSWKKGYPLGPHYRLDFIGMNSVQVCDSADLEGQMILGNAQYIFTPDENVEYVVLVHHPLHWFRDRANASRYLKQARVLMVGHEHSLEIKKVSHDIGEEQLEIYAGATNPPETGAGYPYRYNWLEFALAEDRAERRLRVTIHPRVWDYERTRFAADLARLNGETSFVAEVACPNFQPAPAVAPAIPSLDSPQVTLVGETMAEQGTRDFERLQYYFWTYLDWHDRLKALVEIDVLPATRTQPVPQTFERMALETAKKNGRLEALWDVVMRSVPIEKRGENPFSGL